MYLQIVLMNESFNTNAALLDKKQTEDVLKLQKRLLIADSVNYPTLDVSATIHKGKHRGQINLHNKT